MPGRARIEGGRATSLRARMSAEMPEHVSRLPLRWRDMDILGHLNQSVYHELLEEGRTALLGRLLDLDDGAGFVLARVELDHVHEVRRSDEEVEVAVRVLRVGTKSVTLHNELRLLDGTVCARGELVIVGWDPKARAARAFSAAERERLGAGA